MVRLKNSLFQKEQDANIFILTILPIVLVNVLTGSKIMVKEVLAGGDKPEDCGAISMDNPQVTA